MTQKLVAACLQITSGPEIAVNLERIEPMIRAARGQGAELIALPENADFKVIDRARLFERARTESDHPALPFFARMAQENGVWILVGSLSIRTEGERLANRSYLFTPQGQIAARYDKIHMFDADVGETRYRESNNFQAGNRAVMASTPWGGVGLTICYDVRFAYLYRALAQAGAAILTVPAAFTVPTGRLHWHTLLRARAIETGCFILAPGQCGTHDGNRETYGHSLIIAPDGTILAEAGEEPMILRAELDLAKVTEARHMVPSLTHDRPFAPPVGR